MRKNILSIAAVALLLASCSENENSLNIPSEDTSAKVSVALGNYGGRSMGVPTVDGDIVAVNATEMRFIPAKDGVAYDSQAMLLPLEAGAANEYTAIAGVAQHMTGAFLELNFDNETLTSNVNTRQGDVTEAVVMVDNRAAKGVETEFVVSGSSRSLTTDLIPEMARMQIVNNLKANHDFKGNTAESDLTIKNVTLEAIYINNTKLDRKDANLDRTADNQSDWDAAYIDGGVKYSLYDEEPTAGAWTNIIDDKGVLSAGKETGFFGPSVTIGDETEARIGSLGYNIFEQALSLVGNDKTQAKQQQPHISFKLTFEGTGVGKYDAGTTYTRYLNIVAFKEGSKYTKIERGNVYEISMSDILELVVDPETELTETPDPIDALVEVTVKVTGWVVVPVTPELS